MTMLNNGDRVQLRRNVVNDFVIARAGLRGTLVRIERDDLNGTIAWVKLDRHLSELDDWENELEVRDWNDDQTPIEFYLRKV